MAAPFPNFFTLIQNRSWSKYFHQQAQTFALHAYVQAFNDNTMLKSEKLAVRQELLNLLWPVADLGTPTNLDTTIRDSVKTYGFDKRIEDDILSQLSNCQKKMCEDKLRAFIESSVFDNLVQKQLPSYIKNAKANPSKVSSANEELLHKLRHALSMLQEPNGPQNDASMQDNGNPQSPSIHDSDNLRHQLISSTLEQGNAEEDRLSGTSGYEVVNMAAPEEPSVEVPLPWQCHVKNTFIELRDDAMQTNLWTQGPTSCFGGCWSHHAKSHQGGRAESDAELASHWENQVASEWHPSHWGTQEEPNQSPMSPSFLRMVIDGLKDVDQDAAELAGYISANVMTLDLEMKTKAAENLKACVNRVLEAEALEKVLKALAACTALDFLNHIIGCDKGSKQYLMVASVFAEHLHTEQLGEQHLPQLLQIVTQHRTLQNEAADIVVSSCVKKMLEVHRARGLILGVNVATGEATRLLSDMQPLAGVLQECSDLHACVGLFTCMHPLPEVVKFLHATGQPKGWELALEEVIRGFDRIASMLLDMDHNEQSKQSKAEKESQKDMARKIISEALQHDLAKQSVDLHKWIWNRGRLCRSEMRKRFFIFGLLLGEADIWQLIAGSFRNSDGPQQDMLSAAMATAQYLVPFRRDNGVGARKRAKDRMADLLSIKHDESSQYRTVLVSNLASCIGTLVEKDFEILNGELPERICKKLMELMTDTTDKGVLESCSWALHHLVNKWTCTSALRLEIRYHCQAIQDLFASEGRALRDASSILDRIGS